MNIIIISKIRKYDISISDKKRPRLRAIPIIPIHLPLDLFELNFINPTILNTNAVIQLYEIKSNPNLLIIIIPNKSSIFSKAISRTIIKLTVHKMLYCFPLFFSSSYLPYYYSC